MGSDSLNTSVLKRCAEIIAPSLAIASAVMSEKRLLDFMADEPHESTYEFDFTHYDKSKE